MKTERTKPDRDAFTLLEVLLAVAVFSVVLLAIHGVFFGALRLRNKTVSSLERALPLQQTLAILQRDLANIVPPGGTLFGEFQSTPTMTTSNAASSSLSSSSGLQSPTSQGFSAFNSASTKGIIVSPTFYTANGIISDNAPWGEVQRVLYFLAQPTNNTVGRDLVRSVTRNLLPTLQDQSEDQRLLSGVQDVAFSFYDGTSWLEVWDSTQQSSKLPQAIKVEVLLAVEDTAPKVQEPITVVVPLQVQAEAQTNQTTQAGGGGQ
jgi:prepilin-type N-terminal cleavage/methylation domain-containing protein